MSFLFFLLNPNSFQGDFPFGSDDREDNTGVAFIFHPHSAGGNKFFFIFSFAGRKACFPSLIFYDKAGTVYTFFLNADKVSK